MPLAEREKPEVFDVFVKGIPRPQGRPRIVRFPNGKAGLKDPDISRDWKNYVRMVAGETWGRAPEEGPVALFLTFYLPIPRSWSKKRRMAALAGEIWPTGRPDLDNLAKAVIDAIIGVVIADDRQIVELSVAKFYGANPGVNITLRRLS